MLRYTVHFEGHVQGVGFRFTTVRVARRFEAAGYVRNLPDGRVQLVAEGEKDQLDGLVEGVKAAMGGHIRKAHVATDPATGEFGQPSAEGITIQH